MKKFDETSLPPKASFYSKFTGEGNADEDYQHAQTAWKEFNIESMKNYQNLYNLSDVLLLADSFDSFKNICMNHYGLDPAWYFNAAGMLLSKLHRLNANPVMLLVIESGIRGGISTISHRHAKANNKYIRTEFDPAEESKFISYLDAINLYDWAMSKRLPTSGFERMTDNELDDWKHLSKTSA